VEDVWEGIPPLREKAIDFGHWFQTHLATENKIQAEHEEVLEKTKQMVREQFASSGPRLLMEVAWTMFVDKYLESVKKDMNYMNIAYFSSELKGSLFCRKIR